MVAHILVAYTSQKGSTAEIALAIAKELEKAGAAVTVSDLTAVSSVADYNAIVIGAPVYTGKIAGDVAPSPGATGTVLAGYRLRDL